MTRSWSSARRSRPTSSASSARSSTRSATRPAGRGPGHAQPGVHPESRPSPTSSGRTGSSPGSSATPMGMAVRTVRAVYHRVDAPIIVMRGVDASLAKLGANLFLATKISFANELARLCDAYGGRVDEVVGAMAYDARIGGQLPQGRRRLRRLVPPAPGHQTVRNAAGSGSETPLLAAVDRINHDQRTELVDRLAALTGGELDGTPDRAPRPDVQAGHRRPPRGARPTSRSCSSSVARPSWPTTRWSAPGPAPRRSVAGLVVVDSAMGAPRRCRCGRAHHRMGRVRRARLGRRRRGDAPGAHRRRAQLRFRPTSAGPASPTSGSAVAGSTQRKSRPPFPRWPCRRWWRGGLPPQPRSV